MFTIYVERLKVFGHIGVYDFEKENGQNFLIWAEADIDDSALSDDIETSVDYTKLVSSLKNLVRESRCDLLETFAKNMLASVMARYPAIMKMRVRVQKEAPPIDAELSSVGVSTQLCRNAVYLSLGSNVGDRMENLQSAISRLDAISDTRVLSVSDVYETSPVDCTDGGDYLNCAVKLSTLLSPLELLHAMQDIENELGRVRPYKNAPRTIDMDMLLYGGEASAAGELILPHPRMLERKFVLVPLLDIYDESSARRLFFSDALSRIESDDRVNPFGQIRF